MEEENVNPEKKGGYKKKRETQIREAVNDGKIDELLKLVDESTGPNTLLWTITNFRDVGLHQHMLFVNGMLSMQSNPKKNPYIWYLLTQELCFRAMFTNFKRYTAVLQKFPADNIKDMAAELQHESGENDVSFSVDHIRARNILLSYFEYYSKLIETVAAMAAVVSDDPRWNNTLSETYLSSVFGGRYSALIPDKQESFIRNAFTHRDVTRCPDGSFILKDLHDKKTKKSVRQLDDLTKLNATRMVYVIQALSLPSAVQYEVVRALLTNQKGEQK
jgi:hypothetical protein